ncbi:MAG TPA: hypothetical protein PLJ38_01390, partial [bacterium]|nr:hypothetical protein [bacterium]
GGKLNTKFDNLEKIALNESSRKDIIAVDKMAIYKLYADVLLEKLNSILANYIDNQNIEQLKLQYTTLKESNMNLTNMISQGYTIHKTISLIKLRNYISTILMKLEQLQKLAKALNKDEAMLKILKEMAKTKNFSELEKYGDVLDSPEYSIDTKLQYITDIKNNNNITLTTKLMDYFFKTDNPRIKEHIV